MESEGLSTPPYGHYFSCVCWQQVTIPSFPPLKLETLPFWDALNGALVQGKHSTVSEGGLNVYIFTLKHQMFNNADFHKSTAVFLPSHEVLPFPWTVRSMQTCSTTGPCGLMEKSS